MLKHGIEMNDHPTSKPDEKRLVSPVTSSKLSVEEKTLAATMLRGISINVVVAETGYQETELKQIGMIIPHHPNSKITYATVDQSIGWYGNVNLIGHPYPDTNVIRLSSPNSQRRSSMR